MPGDTTEQVRALAAERGVSERTAWRWFAEMRAAGTTELLDEPRVCRYCRRELPEDTTIRRLYCDDRHRQYARRRRLARASHHAARRA
jgi:hypothetical protein